MCEGIRINPRLRFRKEYNFWCSKIVNTIQLYMFLSKPYKILHFSKWENQPKGNKKTTNTFENRNAIPYNLRTITITFLFKIGRRIRFSASTGKKSFKFLLNDYRYNSEIELKHCTSVHKLCYNSDVHSCIQKTHLVLNNHKICPNYQKYGIVSY